MRELLIVLRREFLERVRTKSFIFSTILTPLFFGAFAVGPGVWESMSGGRDIRLALVDETAEGIGAAAVDAVAAGSGAPREDRLLVSLIRRPAAPVRDSLTRAVLEEEIEGYVVVPEAVMEGAPVELRARTVTDRGVERRLGAAVNMAVQAERLERAGLDPSRLAAILAPVRVEAARLTREGGTGEGAESGIIFSMLVGFALYLLILLYGAQVLQSVQEEKTNRIAEILVSSIRASHLMLGKVMGVGAAALLQISIWIALAALVLGPGRFLLGNLDVPTDELAAVISGMGPGVMLAVLLYLLLGFLLYATLFAAAGAAAGSSEDAQRFTIPLIMPLMAPMLMAAAIVSAPQGTLAVTLGWIPFTMPLAMPMRIGAGGIGTAEILGTLAALAASVALLGWLAGKIYRMGILSTGKRPTLGEVARWLRTA